MNRACDEDKFGSKTIKSFLGLTVSNIVLLTAKGVAWLIVPKLLGVTEYGYYKTFTLYLVYVAFLHFGFPDGILLLHGGQTYDELNKYAFRRYSRFYITLEVAVAACILCLSFFLEGVNRSICIMLSIDALLVNMTIYFKYITQAVMRFHEIAKRNFAQGIIQLLVVLTLSFLSARWNVRISGIRYVACIIAIDFIGFFWYLIICWDIIWGNADSFASHISDLKKFFSNGIILTVAYQIANLVYTLDSQMVNILFDVQIYSLYSFSYSILHMITNTIGAISTVLFPSLRRLGNDEALQKFPQLMAIVSILSSGLLVSYFPISWFVKWYLPEYIYSLTYLKIIAPGIVISCCISMVIFTYYKVINCLREYMRYAVIALLIGLVLNAIGYYFSREPYIFSVASILTLYIWYLLEIKYLVNRYNVLWKKNYIYVIVQTVIFYMISNSDKKEFGAMVAYLILCFLSTAIIYRKSLIVGKHADLDD